MGRHIAQKITAPVLVDPRELTRLREDSRLLDKVLDPEGPFYLAVSMKRRGHWMETSYDHVITTRDDIRRVAGEGEDGKGS